MDFVNTPLADALLHHPVSVRKISPGEDFTSQVLSRLDVRLAKESHLGGFFRTHLDHVLIGLLILGNSLSIGMGLHAVFSSHRQSAIQDPCPAKVYFIDSSPSQVYNHLK